MSDPNPTAPLRPCPQGHPQDGDGRYANGTCKKCTRARVRATERRRREAYRVFLEWEAAGLIDAETIARVRRAGERRG